MSVNQGEIFSRLEKLHSTLNKGQFIYEFLTIYGLPPATITRLKNDDRNVATRPTSGEVAYKKGIYFKPVMVGEDIYEIADLLKASTLVEKHQIRFVIVTDFVDVIAYDIKTDERLECSLTSLHDSYTFFLPLAGYEKAQSYDENPADVKAAEQMGKLFDLIKEKNNPQTAADIHALNVFLTRLLFCFFAEDTGIFEANQMTLAIDSATSPDGSDVAAFLDTLFEVLNLPEGSPQRLNKPGHFKDFPYVNGGLFKTRYPVPAFTAKARRMLIDCGSMSWQDINPDIFGSMFQSVIDVDQRGSLGQHYTSVTNIMKVIQPLFLDKLHEELEKSRGNADKLKTLIKRLSNIKIFDPACGSGNFLIIAYKELRKLEMAAFKALDSVSNQKEIFMSGIRLSQFYGIEIDDFAHEIALLSLWLTEHQMNGAFKEEFGYAEPTLPLKDSGNIVSGNSLQLSWSDVCPKSPKDEVYVCGNPPFLGHANRSDEQNSDMSEVFSEFRNFGKLDFVCCWFWKAAKYIKGTLSEAAFVSTNSICQGVQVETLWPHILGLNVSIRFAFLTFSWKNSARDNAAVHVIIVGLTANDIGNKRLYKYINNEWHSENVNNINPYLIDGPNVIVKSRSEPFTNVPKLQYGSMPNDGGYLLLSAEEKDAIIARDPAVSRLIKKCLGADEFMNGAERYCLWLVDEHQAIDSFPLVKERVLNVKKTRSESSRSTTRELAQTPHLFGEIRQPKSGNFILVPYTTSERRVYVPVGFYDHHVIALNSNNIIPSGTLYEAGVIMSTIHTDWMRTVGSRLKSDYRYSASLVYNTFPWPTVNDSQKKIIEQLSEKVLLIREHYPEKTLAQLYDPEKMPEDLLAAHKALDIAVEKLYRDKPFKDSSERLECLFRMYEKLASADDPKKVVVGGQEELW